MNIELVVTDFNGVVYENPNESDIWAGFVKYLIKDNGKKLKIHKSITYFTIGLELKKLIRDYDMGKIDYGEIFNLFNEKILSGLDVEYVNNYIGGKYAKSNKTKEKINREFLDVMKNVKEAGKETAILSTGCHEGIEALLREVGVTDYFDEILANKIKTDKNGTVDKFELKISDNNGRKKGKVLKDMLNKKGIDERKTSYIGHGPEDRSVLKIVGHPIIYGSPIDESLLEELKDCAFVPEDEQELKHYLLNH